MSESFRVAIPSYRRAETITKKTLPLLINRGIDPAIIDVFIVPEDADAYRPITAAGANVVPLSPVGLAPNRNHIARHYPPGTSLVEVDDDLSDIQRRLDDKHLAPVSDLKSFFGECFEAADASGVALWGLYPVLNPMFMRAQSTLGLAFCVGSLWGVTLRHRDCELVEMEEKEDYERSMRFFLADGAVLRFNHVAAKTRYYREPGGMQEDRTIERAETAVAYLTALYPSLCARRPSRKAGFPEMRIRVRPI